MKNKVLLACILFCGPLVAQEPEIDDVQIETVMATGVPEIKDDPVSNALQVYILQSNDPEKAAFVLMPLRAKYAALPDMSPEKVLDAIMYEFKPLAEKEIALQLKTDPQEPLPATSDSSE